MRSEQTTAVGSREPVSTGQQPRATSNARWHPVESRFTRFRWVGDATSGFLRLIDQTRLPTEYFEIDCQRRAGGVGGDQAVAGSRCTGDRRGGGVRSGGRCAVAGLPATPRPSAAHWRKPTGVLRTSRPTAVNLFWALDRMDACIDWSNAGRTAAAILERLLAEARKIDEEDRAMCRAIGRHGRPWSGRGRACLTHCNAGGLATADYGTALAVIFAAHEQGTPLRVFADETRPLLQGARLTAWELQRRGIPVTLICDNMAAQVMREGKVQMVVVGADRIASNGDTANKIGTYGVALLAKAHGIPFYVAAPSITFDLSIPDGPPIPIEQRDPREITHGFGRQTAPEGVDVYNPAFDVTPAELIAGIITEKGIIRPVNTETVRELLSSS